MAKLIRRDSNITKLPEKPENPTKKETVVQDKPFGKLTVFPGSGKQKKEEQPLNEVRLEALKKWRAEELREYKVSETKDTVNPSYRQVADAIIACDGYIMKAAIRLKISYAKIHKIIQKNVKLKTLITDAKEAMLDMAESKLRDAILAGDKVAIIFFLKTQGKFRGWREEGGYEDAEGSKPVSFAYDLALPPGMKIVDADNKVIYEKKKAEGEN